MLPSGFDECASKRVGAALLPAASNIVWVVDSSASMNEEAAIVQQNINGFVQSLESSGLDDYRVAMVTMPDFLKVPEPLNSDIDHFRFVVENVQSHDGLSKLLDRIEDLDGFLLKNVVTHFVVVTDDDSTRIDGAAFVGAMRKKLNGEIRVHAIAAPPGVTGVIPGWGLPNAACNGLTGSATAQGVQVYEAAKLSGGLTLSICTDDWSALFSELENAVAATALPCNVELPAQDASQAFDTNRVNVVYSAPGQSGTTLPNVSTAAGCGDKRGWHYDNEEEPERIVLCPESCAAAEQGGALDIALGCETIGI